jgi:hypothetical protein
VNSTSTTSCGSIHLTVRFRRLHGHAQHSAGRPSLTHRGSPSRWTYRGPTTIICCTASKGWWQRMPEERAQRRLAAILVADVVGYSRLMQADEAGTLTALKERLRKVLQPAIAAGRGDLVACLHAGRAVIRAHAAQLDDRALRAGGFK